MIDSQAGCWRFPRMELVCLSWILSWSKPRTSHKDHPRSQPGKDDWRSQHQPKGWALEASSLATFPLSYWSRENPCKPTDSHPLSSRAWWSSCFHCRSRIEVERLCKVLLVIYWTSIFLFSYDISLSRDNIPTKWSRAKTFHSSPIRDFYYNSRWRSGVFLYLGLRAHLWGNLLVLSKVRQ